MKRNSFIILMIMVFSSQSILSQELQSDGKINGKVAYSNYILVTQDGRFSQDTRINILTTDIAFNFTDYIDLGIYFGYGFFEEWIIEDQSETMFNISFNKYSNALFYGVDVNLHYLPVLVKKKNIRFDLYINGKMGSNYKFTSKDAIIERGSSFDYGVYAGASYYFGQHLGAFFEYGFSNTYNMRYGLTFKF